MSWHSLKKKQSGFTLTELVVAIAMLAILASIAIPGFSAWLPEHRLKRAARELYSNIQLAKLEAIKKNQNCKINVTTTPGRYTINCLGKAVSLGDYGSGVKFQAPRPDMSSTATITFSSRGLCNIADLFLSNDKNTAYYRVHISSSGAATLRKWDGSSWE